MKNIDAKKAALFDELHRHLHNLVNKHKTLDRTPRNFGLEEPLVGSEVHTIAAIGESSMANITKLAKNLGITKAAASQAVRKLHNKGYLRKLRDDNNRREVYLALTDKGERADQGHKDVWSKTCTTFLSDLTDDQIIAFNFVAERLGIAADDEVEINVKLNKS